MYPGGPRKQQAKRRNAEVTGAGLNMASARATRSGRAFAGPAAVVSASTTVSAREQEQAASADAGGSQL